MSKQREAFFLRENRAFENSFIKFLSGFLIILGSVVSIYTLHIIGNDHHIPAESESINLAETGQFGDFIGGVVGTIFSLVGVLLLFKTLRDQRTQFHRERLESNFLELIRFHRDNVSELTYTYHDPKISPKDNSHRVTAEKHKVFRIFFSDFKAAYQELNYLFEQSKLNDIYIKSYLQTLQSNSTLNEREIDLKKYAQIDITYLLVFLGVDSEGGDAARALLKRNYNEDFINLIIEIARLKPKKESNFWHKWLRNQRLPESHKVVAAILAKRKNPSYIDNYLSPTYFYETPSYKFSHDPYYPDNYEKYYGGHQFRLGHYFRHFYQAVKFIDREIFLAHKEKYNYIKILRGQLSTYEQAVLFLNSLSQIGRKWELESRKNNGESLSSNKHLITKYNLIKNIPSNEIVKGINLTDYYPCLSYEGFYTAESQSTRKLITQEYL